MNNVPLQVNVTLTNEKVQFSGQAGDNQPIAIDYAPPLGDGAGYTSLELFLVSLASCSGSTVATLLRRMRKTVLGLKVNASGLRREQHPTSFETVKLEFIVNSNDVEEGDIEKAIQLSEETFCPVWAMVKNNVEIITEYQIMQNKTGL